MKNCNMDYKTLIGRKCKGFYFGENENDVNFVDSMTRHIGEIGIIENVTYRSILIKFHNDSWYYPKEFILEHLIQECIIEQAI